jgi:CsoR family transcriptional regulator, copper-sensing transcriptional repressor
MRADAPSTLARLRTARGHLDSIVNMVADDRYCIDILHQLSAVQGSLDRVRREIFDAHLRSCVPTALTAGRLDEVVEEVVGAAFGAAPRRQGEYGHPVHCHDRAGEP